MQQDRARTNNGDGQAIWTGDASAPYEAPAVRLYTLDELSQPAMQIRASNSPLSEEGELSDDPYAL